MNDLRNDNKKSEKTICSLAFAELPKITFYFFFWLLLAGLTSCSYKNKSINDATKVPEEIAHFISEQMSAILILIIVFSVVTALVFLGLAKIIEWFKGNADGFKKVSLHAVDEICSIMYALGSFLFAATLTLVSMGKVSDERQTYIYATGLTLFLFVVGILVKYGYFLLTQKLLNKTHN
jgi:hypothetical protein